MKTHPPHTRNPVQIQPERRQDFGDAPPPAPEDHPSDNEDDSFENQPFDQPDDWQDPPSAHIKTKAAEDVCMHPHINSHPCDPTGAFLPA
ncbi:hypothetical protein APHAL10511_008715, partial [Amanita phalloides]